MLEIPHFSHWNIRWNLNFNFTLNSSPLLWPDRSTGMWVGKKVEEDRKMDSCLQSARVNRKASVCMFTGIPQAFQALSPAHQAGSVFPQLSQHQAPLLVGTPVQSQWGRSFLSVSLGLDVGVTSPSWAPWSGGGKAAGPPPSTLYSQEISS